MTTEEIKRIIDIVTMCCATTFVYIVFKYIPNLKKREKK